jgi:predicted DNA-binding transcriptional regulator YafY
MASTSIRVDPTGWGQMGSQRPPFVDQLSKAVVEQRQCRINYQRPSDDEPSPRRVHPLGLVTKRGVWYLIANTDRGLRTYRVSRIHGVEQLDDPVDRPAAFDLDAQWQRIVEHVESQQYAVIAKVRISPEVLMPVRWMFGSRYVEDEQLDDGSVIATLSERSAEAIAHQLAGLGAKVKLLDPPTEVVDQMRRIAAELGDQWL